MTEMAKHTLTINSRKRTDSAQPHPICHCERKKDSINIETNFVVNLLEKSEAAAC